jgi:alpha-galactosidase
MLALYVPLGLILAGQTVALVSRDGTGRLPAMGWNSWNEYGCDITENDFVKVGQLLTSLGLKDLGYEYVNIDDCWSDKEKRRDPTTKEIIPDKAKFPQGISHTADLIHSLGLKIGIYSDAGSYLITCLAMPTILELTNGSQRHRHLRRLCWFTWIRRDRCSNLQQVGD